MASQALEKKWLCALFVIAVCVFLSCKASKDSADDLLKDAVLSLDEIEGFRVYDDVYSISGEDVIPRHLSEEEKAKKLKQIAQDIEKAISIQEDINYAHFFLGLAYIGLRDQDRAESEFKQDIKSKLPNQSSFQLLSTLLLSSKKYSEVKPVVDDYMRHFPQKIEDAMGILAVTCFFEKDYDCAIKSSLRALSLDNRNADTYLLLAKSYMAVGDFDNASACFNKALEIDPSYSKEVEKYKSLHPSQGSPPGATGRGGPGKLVPRMRSTTGPESGPKKVYP